MLCGWHVGTGVNCIIITRIYLRRTGWKGQCISKSSDELMIIFPTQVNTFVYTNSWKLYSGAACRGPQVLHMQEKDQHINTDINAMDHVGGGSRPLEAKHMQAVMQEVTVALKVVPV